jgi:hypothetical protein
VELGGRAPLRLVAAYAGIDDFSGGGQDVRVQLARVSLTPSSSNIQVVDLIAIAG